MSSPPVQLVSFQVNGSPRSIATDPGESLVATLRDQVGLTGAKIGCEMGNCGACTVLLDSEPVYACLVLTAECEARAVETVEGMADGGTLSPVQQAFVDNDALQCGFCTPGQVVIVESLRRRHESGELHEPDLEHELAGNLCRCGAYRHILAAARAVLSTTPVRIGTGS